MEDFKKATKILSKGIKLCPYNPGLYANQAAIYEENNELELALETITKSIDLDPTDF